MLNVFYIGLWFLKRNLTDALTDREILFFQTIVFGIMLHGMNHYERLNRVLRNPFG